MTNSNLEDQIIAYVKRHPGASFVELTQSIPGLSGGNEALCIDKYNVCMWMGLTPEGAAAFRSSKVLDAIKPKPCSVLVYVVDGGMLTLPIAKQARKYKKLHWVPTVFYPADAKEVRQ